jgi:hypothetical protein
MFLGSPFFAERFLSDNPVRLNFWLHYSANQGPYLSLGTILAISYLGRFAQKVTSLFNRRVVEIKFPNFKQSRFLSTLFRATSPLPITPLLLPTVLSLFVLYKGIRTSVMYGAPLYVNLWKDPKFLFGALDSSINPKEFEVVPKEASVCAQAGLIPRFANREQVHMFPDCPQHDYLVLSPIAYSYPFSQEKLKEEIGTLESSGSYATVSKTEKLVVFKSWY